MVKEWPMSPIGDIFDFKNGLNKGKEYFGYGTPIVNYTDVYHHVGLYKKDIKGKVCLTREEIRRFGVKKNDVFFTRTSETPEEVGISSVLLEDIEDCVFSGFVLRGRPIKDDLLAEYCKYCFSTKAVRTEIIQNCTYTTRALTNGKVLSKICIPIPPKPEQEEIARILSSFENYIKDLGELIEKKKGIRDGALEELVTGKYTIDGQNLKWDEKELNAVAFYKKGRATSERRYYVSTENMRQNFSGIDPYNGSDIATGCQFDKTDTLIANIRPYLKKIWFAEFSGCCSADVLVIKAKEDMNSRLLYYLLANERFINYVMSGGIKGIKMPRGDKEYIMHYPILVPADRTNQGIIANSLAAMDEEIEMLEIEQNKIIQIREGAMDDLLTGRVRLTK